MSYAPFALRPLERRTPLSALEGGFRVHLSPLSLRAFGLVAGDLVRIQSTSAVTDPFETAPDGRSSCIAIAWQAADTNMGSASKPIAKVTELLRETYGFKLADKVEILPVLKGDQEAAWRAAKTVWVRLGAGEEKENLGVGVWLAAYGCVEEVERWAGVALGDVDMIVPNCSFEIQRKGIRYRQAPHKVRLVVERVDVEGGEAGAGPVDFVPGKSQVKFVGGDELEQVKRELAPAKPIQIEGEGIGGLDDQINAINEQLRLLTQPPFPRGHRLDRPSSVLVHGPEGTGKSLLLERLARAPWQQVIRLDRKWISTYSKVASKVVTEVFQKAQASQPSLILIDRLDKLLGKAETLCDDLADEILGLKGSRVFVAAATRSIYDIDASLRESVAFRHSVEIFPPNLRQREDILRQVMGTVGDSTTIQYESIAERTHGFVGRDLEKLCVLARDHCVSRAQALTNSPAPSDDPSAVVAEEITQDDFDAVIDKVHASIMKEVVLEVPKVQWDDIGGLEDVRQLMHSVTVRPFKNPDLAASFGSAQNRKGVLLYGPPGCAKTLVAQAVATESKQNFLAVKGSELINMYVGESERAIRDVFRRARAAKPCIIFFDEIDSIGKSREKSHDSGLNVVTTLLNEMDGIEALKDVFIIAATNRPDILDSALIRAGRFDAHVYVGLPSLEARRQIWQIHTRRMPLTADVDLQILTQETEGSSGADIKGLCAEVVELAISDWEKDTEQKPAVGMVHFQQALRGHVPHTPREVAERYEKWRPGVSLSGE